MKTKMIGKKLLCALLLACMLLSVCPGGAVLAAAPRTVESQGELAFDPLAETQSVAYEQHEAGYAVTLDRGADSVTLTVAEAPASESARAVFMVKLSNWSRILPISSKKRSRLLPKIATFIL